MKAIAERLDGNRILVRVPFSSADIVKSIPGCAPRWKRGTVRDTFLGWSFPLTINTCRSLNRKFGKGNVKFGPELTKWGREYEQAERVLEIIKKSRPKDNLDALWRTKMVAPYLWEAMSQRPAQATAAAFAFTSRQALIADQPGIGKTLETLSALVEGAARRVLILARKTALTTVWEREIYRWLSPEVATVFVADGMRDARASAIQAFDLTAARPISETTPMVFLVCNSEMARVSKSCQNGLSVTQCKKKCEGHGGKRVAYKPVPAWPELFRLGAFDAIVLDESHNYLSGVGERSLLVSQVRNGMMKLPRTKDTMMLPLSGTPWRGQKVNAWGTWNWIRPDLFSSRWTWTEDYFETATGTHEEMIVGDLRPKRVKAFDQECDRWMIRRTKTEVAPDMPEKEYAGSLLDPTDRDSPIGVWLEMTPEQQAAYDQMEANGDAELAGGKLTTSSVLAEITRLRQFASSAGRINGAGEFVPSLPSNKYNWVLDFLDEAYGDGKIIIASQFTNLIGVFAYELQKAKISTLVLTGKTSPKLRVEVQDLFQQSDDHNLILVNTKAGGESINLSRASYMIFLDETYVPDEQEQMEDRGHRIGHPTGLTVYYLRSLGSIEETIAIETGLKEGGVKERLDGRRGLEIRRKRVSVR